MDYVELVGLSQQALTVDGSKREDTLGPSLERLARLMNQNPPQTRVWRVLLLLGQALLVRAASSVFLVGIQDLN